MNATELAQIYAGAAGRILGAALVDRTAWERLAYLCDHYPRRLCGAAALEGAIGWAASEMTADGLENVRAEPVMTPHWVRGRESAQLLEPVPHPLAMLGLGGSVGTPPEGIAAEALVVESLDALAAAGEAARGKIVLFNAPFVSYGETVPYRVHGAARAARQGAVAALVRSVGPGGLYTPHTGGMRYEEGVPEIPAAAVTIEDAEMLHRMQRRGERPRVRLTMEARTLPDAPSANVMAEVRGRELPEEIVLIGGHLDAWDVGAGAMDDGGGCVATWEAARQLLQLGLRPRRTVRVVLFTNEENGTRGAYGYREAHREELPGHVLALEADAGMGRPLGFGLTAAPEGLALAHGLAPLLNGLGADQIVEGGGGVDVNPLLEFGVPTMGLRNDDRLYWQIHHTAADTLDKIDPADLARSVAAIAVMAYVVAEMPGSLRSA
jgi:carboxypeptidase Q